MTTTTLTARAKHLLLCLACGQDRIFASDARPPGWLELERRGLAARDADDITKARLTQAGIALAQEVR